WRRRVRISWMAWLSQRSAVAARRAGLTLSQSSSASATVSTPICASASWKAALASSASRRWAGVGMPGSPLPCPRLRRDQVFLALGLGWRLARPQCPRVAGGPCPVGLLLQQVRPLLELALRHARHAAPQAALRGAEHLAELAERIAGLGQALSAHVAPDHLGVVVVGLCLVALEFADEADGALPALAEAVLILLDLAHERGLGGVQRLGRQVGDLAQQVVGRDLLDGRQVADAHVDGLDVAIQGRFVELAKLGVRRLGHHEAGQVRPDRLLDRVAVVVELGLAGFGVEHVGGLHARRVADLERAERLSDQQVEDGLVDPILERDDRSDQAPGPAVEVDERGEALDRALAVAVRPDLGDGRDVAEGLEADRPLVDLIPVASLALALLLGVALLDRPGPALDVDRSDR